MRHEDHRRAMLQHWHHHHPGQHPPHDMFRHMGKGGGFDSAPAHYAHEIPGLPSFETMVDRYSVTNEKWEVIRQDLYDSAVYPAAGTNQLTFFSVQKGQGTGFGGVAGKTLSDTNMTLSGQVPTNQSYLVKGVSLMFQPTTPTVAAQMPAFFGAQAAASILNDGYIFWRAGNIVFIIGSKPYLEEAPLGKFPPRTYFDVSGALADTTTAAGASQSRIAFPNQKGQPYHISPADLRLEANMNFGLTLNWPEGLQAITNPARVFLILHGLLYRRSQ